jgi:murein DD-endopeptidase MepM/ murein hydrolase activator NlpD
VKAIAPVKGKYKITSPFGIRKHPITGKRKVHLGADLITGKTNEPIIAPEPGTILEARQSTAPGGGYGFYVKMRGQSGFVHLFAHLAAHSFKVKAGDKVEQGQQLGTMGTTGASTGVHLHWEVRWRVKPTDPIKWLEKVNS